MNHLDINIAWNQKGTHLNHSWSGLVNFDQFHWMARADSLEHLAMAYHELGAKHVRAAAMYCELTRAYGPDPSWFGQKGQQSGRSNFQFIDGIIDRLLDIGISPMITTCFIPPALASDSNWVWTPGAHVSPPKDIGAWQAFITEHVHHLLRRYGRPTVSDWYFEVWNEPNLPSFFHGSMDDFFALYHATCNAIKKALPDARVGGPSTARGEWLEKFLQWTRREDCQPDYLISHIYNNDSESGALSPFDGPQEDYTSNSPHFAKGVINGFRSLAESLNFNGEIHWNEWGRSWLPSDPIRETPHEAAFIVKTMSEVSHQADHFAYWCLSDIYDQVGYGRETFHGNYGMLNLQGLRKPAWFAHMLLNRLGDTRIPVDTNDLTGCSGAFATKSCDAFQVLVYTAQEDETCDTEIKFTLPAGGQVTEVTTVDRNHNNIIVKWQCMGSPAYSSREEIQDLKSVNNLQSDQPTKTASTPAGESLYTGVICGSGIQLISISIPV